jgi:leucyl aminopeptidase
MKIFKGNSFALSQNLIILMSKDSSLKEFGFSAEELKYIQDSLADKATQIVLNRYSNIIILQTFDETKSQARLLEDLRNSGQKACDMLIKQKVKNVVISSINVDSKYILALTEGLALSNYQFLKYFSKKDDKISTLTQIEIVSDKISSQEVEKIAILTQAVFSARDMVNEPVSFLTSTRLSEEIKKLGTEAGFSVKVFNKVEIEKMKMGGILAVNQGSTEPPTFSVLEWKPANAKNSKPYILVGKGLVYDTGGHSLKPTHDSMDYMKCDMAGAAAVAGALYAVAKTKLPVHVIGLVPSTDNRLSADAYSPGDVITISDGTTVEVLNTDAEGRLILADALSYAKQFDPELVFTIATLTGAAHRAIGNQGMVGMGNVSEEIQSQIVKAGENVYERVAVFPFWEEYAEQLKSDIADLKNIGGELAGAITAGKFLEHFTSYPFYHLDIAGPAFLKKSDGYRPSGGTGVGVRLFFEFLSNQ